MQDAAPESPVFGISFTTDISLASPQGRDEGMGGGGVGEAAPAESLDVGAATPKSFFFGGGGGGGGVLRCQLRKDWPAKRGLRGGESL